MYFFVSGFLCPVLNWGDSSVLTVFSFLISVCVSALQLGFCFTVDGHLGCFQLGDDPHSTAMNNAVYVFW